jgi:hypothetical protein
MFVGLIDRIDRCSSTSVFRRRNRVAAAVSSNFMSIRPPRGRSSFSDFTAVRELYRWELVTLPK